jgi:membrane-bound lytic murein transglycosylase D
VGIGTWPWIRWRLPERVVCFPAMNLRLACAFTFALCFAALTAIAAQDDAPGLDDLLQSARQWAEENLDESVLRALDEVDQDKVKQFFQDVQQHLQDNEVLDLAALKPTATALLPLLESHDETRPYAAWLRTRLDFLDAAEEFRRTTPPPKVEPGKPPKPAPNPTVEQENRVWKKQLSERPVPKGGSNFVTLLKPIFVEEGVPGELVWLAEVESGFVPTARSPAGAAGLFQLMPATAKGLGLSLWPRDQRFQPEPSARAAARYLKSLYHRFRDWPLALAAYNAGEGTVQRTLERRKAKTFSRIVTSLPAETQMYVPKIDATLLRREGVNLAQLQPPRG